MSRDIFVQDLPVGINSIDEIPDDFQPKSIGLRSNIISAIQSIVPDADFSDPSWGKLVHLPHYYIEVNLGQAEEVDSFALHVSGGDDAEQIISAILAKLHLQALDSASNSGLFQSNQA